MEEQWSKGEIERIIKEKEFQFVYSEKQVKEYYNQKKYAIVKHSKNLRELIQEGKVPINQELSNWEKGYYYIIDTKQEKTEFKSRTQITDIAYALYRENKSDTYGNFIYQVNITSLFNGNRRPKHYPTEKINKAADLTGLTITILSIKPGAKTKQIEWTTIQQIETPEEWEELELLDKPMTEEEDMLIEAIEAEKLREEWEIAQTQPEALDFFDEY